MVEGSPYLRSVWLEVIGGHLMLGERVAPHPGVIRAIVLGGSPYLRSIFANLLQFGSTQGPHIGGSFCGLIGPTARGPISQRAASDADVPNWLVYVV